MNTQLKLASKGEAAANEQIEVARIRVMRSSRQTAVVGEFRAADRVVADWADHTSESCTFNFEITFVDGYVFCGCYEYPRRSRYRPSLSGFVRRAFSEVPAPSGLSRYAIDP